MAATSMLSALGYAGLRATGVPALVRRLRAGGVILGYHNVVRGRHTGDGPGDPGAHLALDRFEWQLRWLRRRFSIVALHELVERSAAGRSVRGLLALAFDDGYRGVLRHALPLLQALRLPATLFVVADAATRGTPFWWDHPTVTGDADPHRGRDRIDGLRGDRDAILATLDATLFDDLPSDLRPANWPALAVAQQEGLVLGAHSCTHPDLTRLSDEALAAEVTGSRDAIERWTGRRPDLFAYPYGRWDRRVREAVVAAGFRAAVTLTPGQNHVGADRYALHRVNIPAGIGAAAFECWVTGLRPLREVG